MIVKSFRKIVLFSTPIYASTDTSNNTIEIVSREKAVIIENKIQEMSSLRLQLALLNNDEQKLTSSKYIESIEKSIDNLKSEIFKLGAKNPSEEFMEKLLLSSYKEQLKSSEGSTILMDNWHPSEIIEQFQGMYDVTGYPTSHNGRTQYHLIFVNNGSDPYLHKTSTKSIYDAFSAGSQTSSYWVNELLKIYGEKLTGSGLGLIHPLLEWVPWELFFSLKPPSQEISSSGDATLFSLNTVTTIKFVLCMMTLTMNGFMHFLRIV
jgi:hypothetical protein